MKKDLEKIINRSIGVLEGGLVASGMDLGLTNRFIGKLQRKIFIFVDQHTEEDEEFPEEDEDYPEEEEEENE